VAPKKGNLNSFHLTIRSPDKIQKIEKKWKKKLLEKLPAIVIKLICYRRRCCDLIYLAFGLLSRAPVSHSAAFHLGFSFLDFDFRFPSSGRFSCSPTKKNRIAFVFTLDGAIYWLFVFGPRPRVALPRPSRTSPTVHQST